MVERIRILLLASNHADVGYPRLDEEAREIDERIQGGLKRESFEVITQWAVRSSDLQKALLRYDPHIVHFSGHGKKKEGIILEDRDGNLKPVSKIALIGLFRHLKGNIKIVFLNACHSRRQIDALQEVIDFTIAMNTEIGDRAAVIFSSHFYQALAFGRSVRTAFELAKNQLELEGIDETKTPQLIEKEGAHAANAYLVRRPGTNQTRRTKAKKPAKERGGKAIVASGARSVAVGNMRNGTINTGDQYWTPGPGTQRSKSNRRRLAGKQSRVRTAGGFDVEINRLKDRCKKNLQ